MFSSFFGGWWSQVTQASLKPPVFLTLLSAGITSMRHHSHLTGYCLVINIYYRKIFKSKEFLSRATGLLIRVGLCLLLVARACCLGFVLPRYFFVLILYLLCYYINFFSFSTHMLLDYINFYIYLCVFSLNVYKYTLCVPGALEGHWNMLDPLDLESWTVVNCMGAGN